MLFEDFEDQVKYQDEITEESTSESEGSPEDIQAIDPLSHLSHILPHEEKEDTLIPRREPQLYLCDDWSQPMEVVRKPKELTVKDKMQANVAKNCLIVTLMSLDLGYGSILERYQRECNSTPPELNSVTLTEEELLSHMNEPTESSNQTPAAPAAMLPSTMLARSSIEMSANNTETTGVMDANLKMYHVMSVKQALREDLAEHAYQFSCRAADWSRSAFCTNAI